MWLDNKAAAGANWYEATNDSLRKIADYGFVLALVTNNYIESPSCAREVEMAIEMQAVVIPVILDNASVPWYLSSYQCYRVGHEPTSLDIDRIVELISAQLQCYIDGPISRERATERLELAQKNMQQCSD